MFANQFLHFRGKNGMYFGTKLFLFLENIELLGSLSHENMRQILFLRLAKKMCKLVYPQNTGASSSSVNVQFDKVTWVY